MRESLKRLGRLGFAALARMESRFDKAFLSADVPPSNVAATWENCVREVSQKKDLRVLEIGSREVTGPSRAREWFGAANYVGFDYYPGPNVDVVGDVHRLSSYFRAGEKFDVIFSSACFEHFAMPWVAALEITRMLKVGGILFVTTHFSYVAHERPWNFFQFSDMGLRVLFSSALGYECMDAGMSNPIVGRFSALADKSLRLKPVKGLYCGSEFLGRKIREVPSFDWNHVVLEDVVSGTTYPSPRGEAGWIGSADPDFADDHHAAIVVARSRG